MTARDELLALAQKCEEADGPSDGLNCAIWDKLGLVDEVHCRSWCRMDGRTDLTREMYIRAWRPAYTASLDCALSLVPEGASEWSASWYRGQAASAEIVIDSVHSGDGATPALALAAAALRACAAPATPEATQGLPCIAPSGATQGSTLATKETDHE